MQVELEDAVTLSGDTDDAGSGWETASDADDEQPAADGAQRGSAMEAESSAGAARLMPF